MTQITNDDVAHLRVGDVCKIRHGVSGYPDAVAEGMLYGSDRGDLHLGGIRVRRGDGSPGMLVVRIISPMAPTVRTKLFGSRHD